MTSLEVLAAGAAAVGTAVATDAWTRRVPRRRLGLGRCRVARVQRTGPLAAWLGPRLRAADLDWPVAEVVRVVIGCGVLAGALGLAGHPEMTAVALLAAAAAAGGLHLARDRRTGRMEADLPDLLETVARSLRSGAALPVALREAAAGTTAAAEELGGVVEDADRGLGLAEALDRWTQRRPRPSVRLVVGALAVGLVAGGTPARGVDGVAATLRDRAEVEREARSLATQARASAMVVTLAPVGFAALGVVGDARSAGFLLGTPAGLACLAAGLTLDAVGAAWMHRIAGRSA